MSNANSRQKTSLSILRKQIELSERDTKSVQEAFKNVTKFSEDYFTCWMCWDDLTGQGLDEWRMEPFSDNGQHPEVCPLCKYSKWKGRRWYPFRYLVRMAIGNPSSRFRPRIPKRKRYGI